MTHDRTAAPPSAPPAAAPAVPEPLPLDARARDGRFVLVFAPSGYLATPLRAAVARFDARRGGWVTHSGDLFAEGGEGATHWLPLPGSAAP